MYLTSSVKRSLFSTGVDIWWESGVLAQPLLHLSSLSLLLPLTPSAPIWAASLQGGERKKVANLALLSHFQGHFVSLRDILTLQAPCGAADLVVRPRGWQTQWHSPTHWWSWVSMPHWGLVLIPLRSAARLLTPAVLPWNLWWGPALHRRNLLYVTACKMCLYNVRRRQADNAHTQKAKWH